jgi:hypothetical protein
MPAAKSTKELRPLCYEHHREMNLDRGFSNTGADGTETIVYGCTEAGCLVNYNRSRGYFLLSQNGNRDEKQMVPRVTCGLDRAPMYLAEIDPENRSFRVWTCPQCGAKRTNEEGLVGMTAQESQDHQRENTAKSESGASPDR